MKDRTSLAITWRAVNFERRRMNKALSLEIAWKTSHCYLEGNAAPKGG